MSSNSNNQKVVSMIQEYYGLEVSDVFRYTAYEDDVFRVVVHKLHDNNINAILKIFNREDSSKKGKFI